MKTRLLAIPAHCGYLVSIAFALAALTSFSLAGGLTVTNANDDGAGSLRQAIADAPDGSCITFSEPFHIQLASELHINRNLTIDASAVSKGVTIDGGSDGDFINDPGETRCVLISNGNDTNDISVAFHNISIQNGAVDGDDAGTNIYNRENLTLHQCDIRNGRAFEGRGGGIFNWGGNLALIGCSVIGNQTKNDYAPGGGICSFGGGLILTGCTVSGNQTQGCEAHGGGIFSWEGNLTLTECTVAGNQTEDIAARGGGIFSFDGDLILTGSTVSGNQTEGFDAGGGGILIARGDLTLTGCTISGNQTKGIGSAGGGIVHVGHRTNEVTRLTHCTIANNAALDSWGGGAYNIDARTIIKHCTIVGNTAASGQGAGISSYGERFTQTEISHSIVRDNVGGPDLALFLHSGTPTNSFTFPAPNSNLIGSLGVNVALTPTNTVPLLLAPLGNYGGPTQTMPPFPSSSAIDAATDSTDTSDQRGFAITDGSPDIGATEFQGPSDLAPLWDSDTDNDGNSFGIEFALGTNPFASDSEHPNNLTLTFDASGAPVVSLGVNPDALGFAVWVIERSPDLQGWPDEVMRSADPVEEGIELIDTARSADPRHFYRFRAEQQVAP